MSNGEPSNYYEGILNNLTATQTVAIPPTTWITWPSPNTITLSGTTAMIEDEEETQDVGKSTYFAGSEDPCDPGHHDFQLVAEDGVNLLAGQRQRLVLYCPKCGTSIIHRTRDDDAS